MTRISTQTLLLTTIALPLLAADSFVPVEMPKDQAVIYIYKAREYGKDVFRVEANGEPVTILKRGTYFPYIASPGTVNIIIRKRPRKGYLAGNLVVMVAKEGANKALLVEPGKEYYLKRTGTFKASLIEVPRETALKDLQKCKLLPPCDSQTRGCESATDRDAKK